MGVLAGEFERVRALVNAGDGSRRQLAIQVIERGGPKGARIAGAAEILAVALVESKLEMAKKFGATHAVTPDALEGIKNEVTRGEGFDYALECVGHPQTIRQAYDITRRGGTAVVVGVGRIEQQVQSS